MKYRREIDGLRAIALVPVVFSHAGFKWFKGTYVMIDLFFVISGYLITSILAKEKNQGTFSAIRFYERRARRLLPALFVMMAASIPAAWFLLYRRDFISFCKSLIAVPVFSSNFLFWSESGYFTLDSRMKPFLQTWSLSVEEQFYLLFPLAFIWLWPKGKAKLISFLLLLSLISMGCMYWGVGNDAEANWYLLPGRIWEFTLGAIIALLPERPIENRKESFWAEILSLIGMTTLLVSVFTFKEFQPFPSFYTTIPLMGTALVIRFASSKNLVGKLLGTKLLVGVGLISYGVFVWHQPLFAFARYYILGPVAPHIYGELILLSFVLAYLSWRFVEAPFRNINFLKRRTFFGGCAITSLIFITLGFVGIAKDGVPERFSPYQLQIDDVLNKVQRNGPPPEGRPTYQCGRVSPYRCIEKWNKLLGASSSLKSIPLAMFGSSMGTNAHDGIKRNGYQPVGLFGSACGINPFRMSDSCRLLANTLYEYVKTHKEIKYLALIYLAENPADVTVTYFQEVVKFWQPLNVKLIVFSQKPSFPYFQESLRRNVYPAPDFKLVDLSLKEEVKTYLDSQGVHFVNASDIFCKITGTCDFKKGPHDSYKVEDFIMFDPNHLSFVGQQEYGRVLLETDPIFKKIISE